MPSALDMAPATVANQAGQLPQAKPLVTTETVGRDRLMRLSADTAPPALALQPEFRGREDNTPEEDRNQTRMQTTVAMIAGPRGAPARARL